MRASYPRNRRKYDSTPLGEYLKSSRESTSMTKTELANRIAVSVSLVSRLESGEYLQPSPYTLQRIATVFNAKIEDLYAMVGYTPASALPDYEPYLHAKYNLSDEAVHELVAYFEFIQQKYPLPEQDDAKVE
jgi:transcriptional regulator with XRE-family HTH domain